MQFRTYSAPNLTAVCNSGPLLLSCGAAWITAAESISTHYRLYWLACAAGFCKVWAADMRVGLIILAAGGSARLAQPKQLLPLRGRTLLRRAAETALASACRPVVVVLGAQADLLQGQLAGLDAAVVNNTQWRAGMGFSIRAGMAALAADRCEGVVIMLCDQPLVSARLLDQLGEIGRLHQSGLAAAEYGGTIGVPAFFSSAFFPQLIALPAEAGAKTILLQHQAEAARVAFPEAALDIDTKEDYQRLQKYE